METKNNFSAQLLKHLERTNQLPFYLRKEARDSLVQMLGLLELANKHAPERAPMIQQALVRQLGHFQSSVE